jgi:hypothetical protein
VKTTDEPRTKAPKIKSNLNDIGVAIYYPYQKEQAGQWPACVSVAGSLNSAILEFAFSSADSMGQLRNIPIISHVHYDTGVNHLRIRRLIYCNYADIELPLPECVTLLDSTCVGIVIDDRFQL